MYETDFDFYFRKKEKENDVTVLSKREIQLSYTKKGRPRTGISGKITHYCELHSHLHSLHEFNIPSANGLQLPPPRTVVFLGVEGRMTRLLCQRLMHLSLSLIPSIGIKFRSDECRGILKLSDNLLQGFDKSMPATRCAYCKRGSLQITNNVTGISPMTAHRPGLLASNSIICRIFLSQCTSNVLFAPGSYLSCFQCFANSSGICSVVDAFLG